MQHNSRTNTKGRVHGTRHNDRNFDVSKADNIDPERVDQNEYWHYYSNNKDLAGLTFEEAELRFYEEHFSEQLRQTNEKYIKNGHPERCKIMADWKMARLYAPEETTMQIGRKYDDQGRVIDAFIGKEKLEECYRAYDKKLEEWNDAHGNPFTKLTQATHDDEAATHIQTRRVWHYRAEDGTLRIGQEKALEAAGVELPDPSKPAGRKNNRKIVFDKMAREMWLNVLHEHGLEVEREALPGKRSRDKEDMIRDKYDAVVAETRQAEEQLAATVEDIKTVEAHKMTVEAQKNELEAQVSELRENAENARKEAKTAFEERDKALQTASDALKRAEEAETRVKELEGQQAAAEADLQELDGYLDNAFKQYNELNDEIIKLTAAVADPEELKAVTITRGFGHVKLSPAPAADKLIETAKGGSAAKHMLNTSAGKYSAMSEQYDRMMRELEEANREAALMREAQSKLMLEHAEAEIERQRLEKQNHELHLTLEQEKKKTSGLSEALTNALEKLKSLLGDSGFGGWLADLFGKEYDPMLAHMTPQEVSEYFKKIEDEYIKLNYDHSR